MSGNPNAAAKAKDGAILWLALSLLLGVPAACLGWVPLSQADSQWPHWAQALALHPEQGWRQPVWTWWTAAWLHGSAQHLYRNLAALALIAAMGYSTRIPRQSVLVWLLAWPLTQIGMTGQALHTYIGMSGVLHAGICTIAIHQLIQTGERRSTLLGCALLAGLILKILMENPWQQVLIKPLGSDINVAPWSHLCGALSAALVYFLTSMTNRLSSVKRLARERRTLI